MLATATIPDLTLPQRLHERLRALGVTVVQVAPGAAPEALTPPRWAEQAILRSGFFSRSLTQAWDRLSSEAEHVVEVWPGLWVAPLGASGRRRRSPERRRQPMLVALLLGHELIESEQWRTVCDEQQIDFQVATARVAVDTLLSPPEVTRLAATLTWMHADSMEIDRRFGEIQGMSKELTASYEELSLLYKLSTSLTVTQPADVFLSDACRELQQVVGLSWLTLQLVENEPRLEALAGRTFSAGPMAADPATVTNIALMLLDRYREASGPQVVDDTRTLGISVLPRIARDLLVVPLRLDGRPIAILFGGDKRNGAQITSVDSKLCDSLANSLTIFLQNTMLYEDVQAMFMGTLHALTSAIDAKDSYTHGHSERVALVARMIAEAIGLDEPTVERIYISGMIHDVGKIGVPESVLTKPGKLTDEEFAQVKLHPQIGARILQDIRQMHDLIPGVLYHHEKWNGRGYPFGLRGEAIPLFGRVIGLADAFDAMSSNRTYRNGLLLEEVLGEIRSCAGQQFDPELAEAFLGLDLSPYYETIKRHQRQRQLDGREAPSPAAA